MKEGRERRFEGAWLHAAGRLATSLLALWVWAGLAWAGEEAASPTNERLREFLRRFPDADANSDNVLTISEWTRYQAEVERERSERGARVRHGPGHITPTLRDISYGPHRRQTLDLWKASSPTPSPVLIYFHGGGFTGGGKSLSLLQAEALEHGISAVSANYRLVTDGPFPAPMNDAGRVVQFVRSRAREWGIDRDRVAVSGDSAGGCLALWVALHDDLAEAASTDPVVRESSRAVCALGTLPQTSCDPDFLRDCVGGGDPLRVYPHILMFYGVGTLADLQTPDGRTLVREASPCEHVDAHDPPLHLMYQHGPPPGGRFSPDAEPNLVIHSALFGTALKQKTDAVGLECHVYWEGNDPPRTNSPMRFLLRKFGQINQPEISEPVGTSTGE